MNPYIVAYLAREREFEIRRETELIMEMKRRNAQMKPVEKQRKLFPDWIFGWFRRDTVCETC